MPKLVSASDIAYFLAPILPLNWMYGLARARGRLQYFLDRPKSATVRNNFRTALNSTNGTGDVDQLARQFFEYRQVRAMQLALAPRMSPDELAKLVPIEGLEHLERALEHKKGVVFLGAHLNSLCTFVTVIMLKKMGYDIRVALPRDDDPWAPSLVRRFVNRMTGEKVLKDLIGGFYCQFNVRPIVASLQENAIIVQTGDGWHSAKFVEVEFLGRTLPFTTGLMSIVQKTGSLILPSFEVGTPGKDVRCVFEEPYAVEGGKNPDRELKRCVAAFVKRLEYHILNDLACWEHWEKENTLDAMAEWPQKPLSEKYSF